jgi:hypothetical protein
MGGSGGGSGWVAVAVDGWQWMGGSGWQWQGGSGWILKKIPDVQFFSLSITTPSKMLRNRPFLYQNEAPELANLVISSKIGIFYLFYP